MGVIHLVFGSSLLLMFGINLLTLPGTESASFFDRIIESEPATKVKSAIEQFLPRPQKDQNQADQEPTNPSTASTPSEPGSVLKRVIGQILPLSKGDAGPEQTSTLNSTTTSTAATTTRTSTTTAADGTTNATKEDGSSATAPPFTEKCYLVKNESGTIKTVNMSRAEAGNDTYTDYEEYCEEDEINTRISAGALASLAGKNKTTEGDGLAMPTYNEICYLQKNDSGVIRTINTSRAAVGNDTYSDYEEICDDGAELPDPYSISAGALASLAG